MTFVANVGEEGLGDLRGMRALFNETMKGQIDRFVSIDGPGLHVTQVAIGSRRYRVTFKGPGGHSFGSFGQPNPANAVGRAVAKIADIQVAHQPVTTFNVGRIGGGTSVNSIPSEAWLEIDLRSESAVSLAALDAKVRAAFDTAVVEENRHSASMPGGASGSRLVVTIELVGDRPAGSIPATSPIVQTVQAVSQALFGASVPSSRGSTDANLPLSLNIPAVTIGGGGDGADAHTATETFKTTDSWKGTENALLVTIALAHQ
jgi:acetylornithine deacetylase/succinyl-diaminopimelate desuccinylase-like protein